MFWKSTVELRTKPFCIQETHHYPPNDIPWNFGLMFMRKHRTHSCIYKIMILEKKVGRISFRVFTSQSTQFYHPIIGQTKTETFPWHHETKQTHSVEEHVPNTKSEFTHIDLLMVVGYVPTIFSQLVVCLMVIYHGAICKTSPTKTNLRNSD